MRKTSVLKTPTLLLPILLGLVLAGCEQEVSKVAVVLPLSGEYKAYGESSRQGLELALEQLRAEGAATDLEVEIADSESDPEVAKARLAELFDAGALAAIGGITTREAAAMAPVAEDRDHVLLSPSAMSDQLAEELRYFYRLAPSDRTSGNTLADYAARELGVETAVVLYGEESEKAGAEEGVKAALRARGGELLGVLEIPAEEGMESTLVEIRELDPDAVYVAADGPTIASTVRGLRQGNFGGKILTTQAFAIPETLSQAGDAAKGVFLTRTVIDANGDGGPVRRFVESYREKYGEDPDVFAAEAYDAMRVLAAALAESPPIASEVRKGLRDAVKSFPGVTGTLEFDASGAVSKYPRVYDVTGELELRDHAKWAEAERQRRLDEIEAKRRKLEELRRKMAEEASQ